MRLKTLGVVLVTALAASIMLFWLTDGPRMAAVSTAQEEELAHFGELIFSVSDTEPAAAGCAQCHGADGTGGEPGAAVIGPSLHTRSLADKLRANPEYVRLAVSYGGVVVSGNVNSQMPAWSHEVGGPLNEQQLEAVVSLVEGWAEEAASLPPEDVPDTPEAGAEVYASAGCASCHGAELEGTAAGPDIRTIGNGPILEGLPIPPSGADQMQADWDSDPALFLEKWIRDSAGNYNDGNSTGMPAHNETAINASQMAALITFLLTMTGG